MKSLRERYREARKKLPPFWPWMIYHVDLDKAHRCPRQPECSGYISSEETGWSFKMWHVYRCPKCGIKVARGLLLPHPHDSGWTWRGRAVWAWTLKPRIMWDSSLEPRLRRLWQRRWERRPRR